MVSDNAKGEDGGAKATVARASALTPRGTFRVTAADGISVGTEDKTIKKGETVKLEGAVIQALLNDGAIEPV